MNRPALMALLNHIWTRQRGVACRAGVKFGSAAPACSLPGPDRDDRSGALPPPGAPLQPQSEWGAFLTEYCKNRRQT